MTPTDSPAPLSGSHSQHSRLAPSAAKQWANCTASIAFIRSVQDRLPKDDSSDYSREGTQAHDYAAALFEGAITLDDIPANFRPHVEAYVEHCRALGGDRKTLEYVESKVPLFYMPTENGTMDYAKVCEEFIWIRDLKYGAGVLVTSQDNEQLAIYALSFIRMLQDDGMYDFSPDTEVNIMAFQPRHHEADTASPWILSLKDLEDFCAAIQAKADLIIAAAEGTLEFCPDPDVCRWCRARALCPARAEAMAEAFDTPDCKGVDFLSFLPDMTKEEEKLEVKERIDLRIENANTAAGADLLVTDSRLVAMFASVKPIKAFLDDVEEYLQAMADQGRAITGTKLVAGREGNREWNDTEAVDKLLAPKLKFERFKKELIGPAAVEKLLPPKTWSTRFKNLFNGYISRSAPKNKIALASDKRDAVQPSVASLPDLTAGDDDEAGL